jgi:hypothetical protein
MFYLQVSSLKVTCLRPSNQLRYALRNKHFSLKILTLCLVVCISVYICISVCLYICISLYLYTCISLCLFLQSVWRFSTGWKVRGSNPCGSEIFRTCPDRSEAHPASYKMGTESLSPGIRCGRGVTLTTHTIWCRGSRRVELYLYSPSGPSWPVLGWTLPLLYLTISASRFIVNIALLLSNLSRFYRLKCDVTQHCVFARDDDIWQ